MRKLWGSLLLVLSLLVSQQGAWLHELSHLADASQTSKPSAQAKARAPGTLCETCLAFDHVAGVVHSITVAPALLATADHWVGDERFVAGDADVPAHSARDPPISL